jgi:hypothetical protein
LQVWTCQERSKIHSCGVAQIQVHQV